MSAGQIKAGGSDKAPVIPERYRFSFPPSLPAIEMWEQPATAGAPSPPHSRPSTIRGDIDRSDRRAIGSALPPRQNSTNDGSNDSAPRGGRTFSFAAEHAASGTPPGTKAAEPRTEERRAGEERVRRGRSRWG